MRVVSPSLPSLLAMAVALAWPIRADAQRSFQGDGQVVWGHATISQTNGTVVQVGSAQTVINWTPNGASSDPAVFQPAGTTALFTTQGGSGLTDFAVLNRILPASNGQPIQLNGTILSRLQGNADQAAGTVYFYSPGGIVIGSTAVIDVGSLGLTTSDPWAGTGDWMGADRTVTFGTSLAGRGIVLQPGSSITSSGSASSYTAIVAPTILHQGSIRTSGGAALVAADAATITFSPDNLYSIQVTAASPSNPGGLTVDGGSIGRAGAGAGTGQRLYLVSIPKNTAVTMLIQGGADLGFTPADEASVDGNAIVLSAGRNIEHGALGANSNAISGNAIIQNATFRDRTVAGISGAANLLAQDHDLEFRGDLSLVTNAATLRAENDRRLAIGGDLAIDARGLGHENNNAGFGGSIELIAGKASDSGSGGTIAIGQNASLRADGTGVAGGIGNGGLVSLTAHGRGRITLGGGLNASADGIGGAGPVGGDGAGGTVRLAALGGSIQLANARLHSNGAGGRGNVGAGGRGRAGLVAIEVSGGSLVLSGTADLRANAAGGVGSAGGTGGDGTVGGAGGLVVRAAQGGTLTAAALHASATATPGAAVAAGGAPAGRAGRSFSAGGHRLEINNGALNVGDLSFVVRADSASANAVGDLISLAGGDATIGEGLSFTTIGSLGVASSGGQLSAGAITLDARNFVAQPASASFGRLEAGQWSITSAGDVIIGANIAGTQGLALAAPGRIQLGNVTASGGDLVLKAGGALAVNDVISSGRALLQSGSSLTSGRISVGGTALALLADGAINTGAIDAPGATILIGDDGMTSGGAADWAALLAATPASTKGPLTVAGMVSGARLLGAVGGDARFGGAVTASDRIAFASGGALTIDGAWTAPAISLTSADLVLGSSASLTATGALALTSSNARGLLIGDGLTGSGYGVSDSEFGRLRGGSITLSGPAIPGTAASIQIGKLTIAGSQLASGGTLRIATVGSDGRTGVLGVAGQVTGSGLGDGQTVEFEAARIEIDGVKGGISLAGANGVPGGQLNLRTDRLWAAEPAILAKLTANSDYVGREADLAQPLATPRPDGIIRAGTVRLVDARQILIQNSGTRPAPSGITTSNGAFLSFTSTSGAIELIANGQIVGPNGTSTSGFAVQSALTRADGFNALQFSANSSINGCLVSAASCSPRSTVTRDEDISLGALRSLPDKMFGDDDEQADDKKSRSSAIAPAEKLVDKKPLERVQQVDEPVSGAGNPALSSPAGGGR